MPAIYQKMLDRIALAKESRLPEDEKIEVQIHLLNTLTTNQRYSFESRFISKNKSEAPRITKSQSENKKGESS